MENEVKEVKKLSYEELENAAQQLSVQLQQANQKNQQLIEVINQTNVQNLLQRLEWLWRILDSENNYLTEEFKTNCATEFMQLMAKPEETKE